MFDYIIVGAGLAGSVMAERLAKVSKKKVLVIEKRNHIGGNCYDYYDKNGILIHKYGPHIFHTNSEIVWEYLSQFTEWHNYEHLVQGFIDGKNVPIPFNLNTLHELLPRNLAEVLEFKLISEFGLNTKIPILELKKSNDDDLKFVADLVYEKIFLNYTKKQWGVLPEELDSSVTERVPVYISRDNRYFQDKFQGIPDKGYHIMFERMLNNPNIELKLGTDCKNDIKIQNSEIYFRRKKYDGILVFTGRIDDLFDYKFGKLPYRSLRFEFDEIDKEFFQSVGTVNYPNNYKFTRITEFKHLTGQKTKITKLVKEYPKSCDIQGDIPYYPIPMKEHYLQYMKYLHISKKVKNLLLLGRLADYKYYNMDVVVNNSLKKFNEIRISNNQDKNSLN